MDHFYGSGGETVRALNAVAKLIEDNGEQLPFDAQMGRNTISLVYGPDCGRTVMAEPLDGIVVSYHRMQSPGFKVATRGAGDGVKINWCASGRLEVAMADGRTLFMAPGDISVETSTAWDFSFPCGFYEGIEIFLYRSSLTDPPPFFASCGIDLHEVVSHLSTRSLPNWTRRADGPTCVLFRSLLPGDGANGAAKLRLGIARLLLALADAGAPERASESPIFTKRQVEIAKAGERMLAGDLSRRLSIEEVARELDVKPTAFKSYFTGVFGKSVSTYLADLRMERACALLRETDKPVSSVAEAVGYRNVGKFCAAFKRHRGVTPLQFRRRM